MTVPVYPDGNAGPGGIVNVTVLAEPLGDAKPGVKVSVCPVKGIVMVSIVGGNQLESEPVGRRVVKSVAKVTVRMGPAVATVPTGAVTTVDQTPGLPESGTVTVRIKVAVLLGPSAMVRVSTEPAVLSGPGVTVTVIPLVVGEAAGTIGMVTVAPEPGTPGVSGIVTVVNEAPGLSLAAGVTAVISDPEGRGSVTVRTGTVTVLLGAEANCVTVTVTGVLAAEETCPTGGTSDEVQVEETESEVEAREPVPEPELPGEIVTVNTVTGTVTDSTGATVTTMVPCSVLVVVHVVSELRSALPQINC